MRARSSNLLRGVVVLLPHIRTLNGNEEVSLVLKERFVWVVVEYSLWNAPLFPEKMRTVCEVLLNNGVGWNTINLGWLFNEL